MKENSSSLTTEDRNSRRSCKSFRGRRKKRDSDLSGVSGPQPFRKHENLEIQFDSIGVYDNTHVGILQTAYASGLKEFPMPCVFTNCHNCLCAVGGTINTDVHKYAESACKKSGGIFVPPHEAVIHQYMREMIVKSGGMSIVSDSHTVTEPKVPSPSERAVRSLQRQCSENIMRSNIRA